MRGVPVGYKGPIDYTGLIKRLDLPPGCTPPRELRHEDIRASTLTRDDLDDDVRGINASLELIRRTRGGWPDAAVTPEDDYVDLVWHELEFRDRTSFTYAVYDYLGMLVYQIVEALTTELPPPTAQSN